MQFSRNVMFIFIVDRQRRGRRWGIRIEWRNWFQLLVSGFQVSIGVERLVGLNLAATIEIVSIVRHRMSIIKFARSVEGQSFVRRRELLFVVFSNGGWRVHRCANRLNAAESTKFDYFIRKLFLVCVEFRPPNSDRSPSSEWKSLNCCAHFEWLIERARERINAGEDGESASLHW